MKQFVPAMIGIGIFMVFAVALIYFNLPDFDPNETYDISIDGNLLGPEPVLLETPAGEEVGIVREVEREDGNTVLEFSRVLRDVVTESSEVYLSSSDESIERGVGFPGVSIGEFVVDVTSEQLEEYQYVVIYDRETKEILASANLE
jgi:hypothetical protein